MSFDGLHALHRRNAALRALIATQAAPGLPLLYSLAPRSYLAGTILVSPDPSRPGRWRATSLAPDGTPTGHVEAPDASAAIVAAWHMGADLDTARRP